MRPFMRASPVICGLLTLLSCTTLSLAAPASAGTLPAIFPTPVAAKLTGKDLALGKTVVLVRAADPAPDR